MFRSRRVKVLKDHSEWTRGNGTRLGFVEATIHSSNKQELHYGRFNDIEAEDWLRNGGHLTDCNGGIRLLLYERKSSQLKFAMKESTFRTLETVFRLPQTTLPVFESYDGMFARHINYTGQGNFRVPHSIEIVAKMPQMYQTGNFGLSLSYSFREKTTLGFLFGSNCVSTEFILYLQDLLQHEPLLWTHPMLLPTIMLQEHLYRVLEFKDSFDGPTGRAAALEFDLGVNRARQFGESSRDKPLKPEILDELEGETTRLNFTTRLNTLLTDIVTLVTITEWDSRYHKFLAQTHYDLVAVSGRTAPIFRGDDISSAIETLGVMAAGINSSIHQLKARTELQLDILYSIIAQADGRMASRMAARAGLDSAAMKTLAVVESLFLPATFVAGVFGMSLFHWGDWSDRPGRSFGNAVRLQHRERFVYRLPFDKLGFIAFWVASTVATIAVLLGWRMWWSYQKWYYEQKFPNATGSQDESGFTFWKWMTRKRPPRDVVRGRLRKTQTERQNVEAQDNSV